MREILFRGKDIKGNWHIGLLAHMGNAWYISNKAGVATAYEVIPSTVGQYTGLTDKNGTRIFEGDIISIPFEEDRFPYEENIVYYEKAEVYFDTEHYGWYVRYFDDDSLSLCEYDDCDITVIGNIHDNPELLKVGDENDT